MTSRIFPTSLKLGLVLAVGLLAATPVLAQSNSTGILAGRATAGDVVMVKNAKTGFSRKITVGKTGRFRVSSLPIGQYQVTVTHADGTVVRSQPANVSLGLTTQVK